MAGNNLVASDPHARGLIILFGEKTHSYKHNTHTHAHAHISPSTSQQATKAKRDPRDQNTTEAVNLYRY